MKHWCNAGVCQGFIPFDDSHTCPEARVIDEFTEGCIHARQKIREALLRLDYGNKGGKWSVEFVLKFLALENAEWLKPSAREGESGE